MSIAILHNTSKTTTTLIDATGDAENAIHEIAENAFLSSYP